MDDLRSLAARAGVPLAVAEHYAPLVALVRVLLDGRPPAPASAPGPEVPDGLHPDHAYSYVDAAPYLGIRPQSVAKIRAAELPRFRSGRVLGIDIMAYRGDVTPADAEAYKRRRREAVREATEARPPARRRMA